MAGTHSGYRLLPLLLAVTFIASGCVGEEEADTDDPQTPESKLSGAANYQEFVLQVMSRHFGDTTLNRLLQYGEPASLLQTLALTDVTGNSFLSPSTPGSASEWSVYVAPGQGYANPYPSQNATLRLTGIGSPQVQGYAAIDYVTGQTGEGEARAYWGVRPAESAGGHVPIILVIEQIVRNNGVPQYRGIGILEGYLLTPITPGPYTSIGPALAMLAEYNLYAVEAFNGGSTGRLINYRACLLRGGFQSAGSQPSGNWCK